MHLSFSCLRRLQPWMIACRFNSISLHFFSFFFRCLNVVIIDEDDEDEEDKDDEEDEEDEEDEDDGVVVDVEVEVDVFAGFWFFVL